MTIRLQTAKGADIPNLQFSEVSAYERNWNASLPSKYPEVLFRTDVSPTYNCHGLTFASRRTRIPDPASIALMLNDDRYVTIKEHRDVKPGDVVIYYQDDGDPSHSGVVLENAPPVLLEDVPLYTTLSFLANGEVPEKQSIVCVTCQRSMAAIINSSAANYDYSFTC